MLSEDGTPTNCQLLTEALELTLSLALSLSLSPTLTLAPALALTRTKAAAHLERLFAPYATLLRELVHPHFGWRRSDHYKRPLNATMRARREAEVEGYREHLRKRQANRLMGEHNVRQTIVAAGKARGGAAGGVNRGSSKAKGRGRGRGKGKGAGKLLLVGRARGRAKGRGASSPSAGQLSALAAGRGRGRGRGRGTRDTARPYPLR